MTHTIARYFLALIGLLYVGLGIWCALDPVKTAQTVGFVLREGQGQSEFMTVYGGLEVGLGMVFLWPLIRRDDVTFSLLACLLVHANLVLFRSISFFVFDGFESTTFTLAACEWMIFLATVAFYIGSRKSE